MVIYFNDELTSNNVSQLINKIESKLNKDDILEIYFSTEGGSLESSMVLVDFINKKVEEEYKIEIIASGEISSGGLIIFADLECRKRVLDKDLVYGIAHTPGIYVSTRSINNKTKTDSYFINKSDLLNSFALERYKKIGITDKEEEDMLNGMDVIIKGDRLMEYAEKINKTVKSAPLINRRSSRKINLTEE